MTELEITGESQHELSHHVQSPATLFKASIVSAVLAAVILVSVVLPAEYGIDPTGIGAALGLGALASSETISEASSETVSESNGADKTSLQTQYREDSVDIPVPAGKGLEYKFHLVKGDSMRYDWSTSEGNIYFDFHGEPDGDTTGFFESYTVSTADTVRGTFTASFDGSHGWYWKNESLSPIVVSLKTQGSYKVIGQK